MASIYNTGGQRTFYAPSHYPTSNAEAQTMGLSGNKNEEMRAMTIAALRLAQNNTELSHREMNKQLLLFLMGSSATAINHWKNKGRMNVTTHSIQLTDDGIEECAKSLAGQVRGYSTSESMVTAWMVRMLNGDNLATKSSTFSV